jgi:hypothetical protein
MYALAVLVTYCIPDDRLSHLFSDIQQKQKVLQKRQTQSWILMSIDSSK